MNSNKVHLEIQSDLYFSRSNNRFLEEDSVKTRGRGILVDFSSFSAKRRRRQRYSDGMKEGQGDAARILCTG